LIHRLFVNVFVALVLSACAASGQLFTKLEPPAPEQSVLYVFRTQYVGRQMDLGPAIAVNGIEVGALPLDGYLRVPVSPGPIDVRMKNRAYLWPAGAPLHSVKVEARPGQMHFVEFSVEASKAETSPMVRTLYLGVSLREVGEDAAMRFLPKLKNVN
jgi:hypothetical protein